MFTRILDRRYAATGHREIGPVVLRATREDLGDLIGVGRNSVSRYLGELENAGVRLRRGAIEIVDNEIIRKMAESVWLENGEASGKWDVGPCARIQGYRRGRRGGFQ
ncbi:helix-turn-helix domain-containing protein [Actinomadura kijaniata]|uniref:helix-turn-helix domain-containing protein n=1 Tax=Actinomadura kijaniata TaxID=46161 RepID=UPI003F19F569